MLIMFNHSINVTFHDITIVTNHSTKVYNGFKVVEKPWNVKAPVGRCLNVIAWKQKYPFGMPAQTHNIKPHPKNDNYVWFIDPM